MTKKISNVVIISPEPETICIRCKKLRECRDVLGNGTSICFSCATEAEKNAYAERLFGG